MFRGIDVTTLLKHELLKVSRLTWTYNSVRRTNPKVLYSEAMVWFSGPDEMVLVYASFASQGLGVMRRSIL